VALDIFDRKLLDRRDQKLPRTPYRVITLVISYEMNAAYSHPDAIPYSTLPAYGEVMLAVPDSGTWPCFAIRSCISRRRAVCALCPWRIRLQFWLERLCIVQNRYHSGPGISFIVRGLGIPERPAGITQFKESPVAVRPDVTAGRMWKRRTPEAIRHAQRNRPTAQKWKYPL
jgi:hypothetical protein